MHLACVSCNSIIDGSPAHYYCTQDYEHHRLCQTCYERDHHACGDALPSAWFRWLNIMSSTSEFDLIECRRERGTLEEAQPLQYVKFKDQGSWQKDHMIICDGEEVVVTQMLHETLKALRKVRVERVWIAQICVRSAHRYLLASMEKIMDQYSAYSIGDAGRLMPVSSEQFRLIRVNPYIPGSTISGRTERFSTQSFPEFHYLRASSTEEVEWAPILLDGKSKRIPSNVAQWMRQGNSTHTDTYCFIVPLCLNHQDDDESARADELTTHLEINASISIMLDPLTFRFSKLPDPCRSVRLIKLYQRPSVACESIIVVDIITVDLDEAPPYTALSHTWGQSRKTSLIICNRTRILRVDPELYSAMSDLLDSGCEYAWIDAICINQEDLAEKSEQVPRMVEIYSHAAEVIVHLLPKCTTADCECRKLSLGFIELLAKVAGADRNTMNCARVLEGPGYRMGIPGGGDSLWEAWVSILSLRWFRRSWVVQEVTVNRNVGVLLHGTKIPLKAILLANHTVIGMTVPGIEQVRHEGQWNLDLIGRIGEEFWHGSGSLPLIDLVERFAHFEASDPRDKIFAFVGLSRDRKSVPPLDYAAPLHEVLFDFACYFAEKEPRNGVRMIATAGSRIRAPGMPGIPSWVPAWDLCTTGTKPWDIWNASGLSGGRWRAGGKECDAPKLDRQERALNVQGCPMGVIVDTTGYYNEGGLSIPDDEMCDEPVDLPEFYRQAKHILEKYKSSYPGQIKAYPETVIQGAQSRQRGKSESRSPLETPRENSASAGERCESPNKLKVEETHGIARGRRFALTDTGYACLINFRCVPGDVICVFAGLGIPYVIRPKAQRYELVSEAYVHGIMDGEALGEISFQEITLV